MADSSSELHDGVGQVAAVLPLLPAETGADECGREEAENAAAPDPLLPCQPDPPTSKVVEPQCSPDLTVHPPDAAALADAGKTAATEAADSVAEVSGEEPLPQQLPSVENDSCTTPLTDGVDKDANASLSENGIVNSVSNCELHELPEITCNSLPVNVPESIPNNDLARLHEKTSENNLPELCENEQTKVLEDAPTTVPDKASNSTSLLSSKVEESLHGSETTRLSESTVLADVVKSVENCPEGVDSGESQTLPVPAVDGTVLPADSDPPATPDPGQGNSTAAPLQEKLSGKVEQSVNNTQPDSVQPEASVPHSTSLSPPHSVHENVNSCSLVNSVGSVTVKSPSSQEEETPDIQSKAGDPGLSHTGARDSSCVQKTSTADTDCSDVGSSERESSLPAAEDSHTAVPDEPVVQGTSVEGSSSAQGFGSAPDSQQQPEETLLVSEPLQPVTIGSKLQPLEEVQEESALNEVAFAGDLTIMDSSADEADGIGGLVINSVIGAAEGIVDFQPEEMETEKELMDISSSAPLLGEEVGEPSAKRMRLDGGNSGARTVMLRLSPVKTGHELWDALKLQEILLSKGTVLLQVYASPDGVKIIAADDTGKTVDFSAVMVEAKDEDSDHILGLANAHPDTDTYDPMPGEQSSALQYARPLAPGHSTALQPAVTQPGMRPLQSPPHHNNRHEVLGLPMSHEFEDSNPDWSGTEGRGRSQGSSTHAGDEARVSALPVSRVPKGKKVCAVCGKKFSSANNLASHMKLSHTEHCCPYCSFKDNHYRRFWCHVTKHTVKECDEGNNREDDAPKVHFLRPSAREVVKVEAVKEELKCPHCEVVAGSTKQLEEHKAQHCGHTSSSVRQSPTGDSLHPSQTPSGHPTPGGSTTFAISQHPRDPESTTTFMAFSTVKPDPDSMFDPLCLPEVKQEPVELVETDMMEHLEVEVDFPMDILPQDRCNPGFDGLRRMPPHKAKKPRGKVVKDNPEAKQECSCGKKKEQKMSKKKREVPQRKVRPVPIYTCDVCDLKFRGCKAFQRHRKYKHHKFSCKACPLTFRSKKRLSRHQKNIHKGLLRCVYFCGALFRDEEESQEHYKVVHNKDRSKLSCPYCDAHYVVLGFLLNHIDRCSACPPDEKPTHVCDNCDAIFPNKNAYKQHICFSKTSEDVHKTGDQAMKEVDDIPCSSVQYKF